MSSYPTGILIVPTDTRTGEGGQLANFYRTITDGIKFGITIENWKGAVRSLFSACECCMFADVNIRYSRSYCEANPSCTNDGGESFLDPSGNFVDGKRSIAGRGLELDPGYYTPATKLRKLETEEHFRGCCGPNQTG